MGEEVRKERCLHTAVKGELCALEFHLDFAACRLRLQRVTISVPHWSQSKRCSINGHTEDGVKHIVGTQQLLT